MDRLDQLTAVAIGQARIVHGLLDAQVLPALPPASRGGAMRLRHRLAAREIFDEDFLESLNAVAARLRCLVDEGTHHAWTADEHHADGGYVVAASDTAARDLAAALPAFDALAKAVAATLDAAEAARATARLTS